MRPSQGGGPAEEADGGQRAPILKAYLLRAPGARPHMPASKDAAVAEFEAIAGEDPVYRLVTSGQGGGPTGGDSGAKKRGRPGGAS